MFRERLDPDAGMLFISESQRPQVFWMKNTLIPLDMIFIGADRRIAGIVENAEPQTLARARSRRPANTCWRSAAACRPRSGSAPAGGRITGRAGDAPEPRRLRSMQPMLATARSRTRRCPIRISSTTEIRRHPGADYGHAARPRGAGRRRNRVTRGQRQDLAVPRGGATRSRAGARGAPALCCWTARSSPSTPSASRPASKSIQDRIHLTDRAGDRARAAANPIAFVAFDLLRDAAEDLCALPLVERRRRLETALAPALGEVIRVSTQVHGDGAALLAEARARGWEGLVVKDARSPYRPGQRSRSGAS